MEEQITQNQDPEGCSRFHLAEDTTFIYNQISGLYEPYQETVERKDRQNIGDLREAGPFIVVVERDRWAFIVSVLTFMVVVAYTVYARQQACAAIEASKAATKSVDDNRASMQLDERAWVSVLTIKMLEHGELGAKVIFQNTGRTPAKNFHVDAVSGNGAEGNQQSLPGFGVIAPMGQYNTVIAPNRGSRKDSSLFYEGTASYDSVFGGQHWTKFCFQQAPHSASFAPCDSGNVIDANKP